MGKGNAQKDVCIIDDDDAFLRSLVYLLDSHGYQTRSYPSADAFLGEPGVLDNTGCLIVDLWMPGTDGERLICSLAERHRLPPCIVLTGHGEIQSAVRLVKLGALDYLQKPADSRVLLECVREAMEFSEKLERRHEWEPETRAGLEELTGSERSVLQGVLEGHSSKQIADTLGLKPRTVEIYRSRILAKTKSASSLELVYRLNTLRIDAEGRHASPG